MWIIYNIAHWIIRIGRFALINLELELELAIKELQLIRIKIGAHFLI